MVIWRKWKESP